MHSFRRWESDGELKVYARRDLVLVRGKNARVWDDKGREFVDCVGGIGVASLGHANPCVAGALAAQAGTLMSPSNLFYNDVRARLVKRLNRVTPGKSTRVFLCNSGAESVEAALKLARYSTGRKEFVCAERSFHGRTLGALSATHKPEYREPFEPLVPGFRFVPFNDARALAGVVSDRTAGVILEVVQGEGGVHVGSRDYFREVRTLCRKRGALLIVDEVQTGFCRTGRWFACQHVGVEPDLLCLAKALGGGVPMGAVVCSGRVKPPLGKHGTTFGGNALACAAALASMEFMESRRLDREARVKGNNLVRSLKILNLPAVLEIRHLGLMIGIELDREADPVIRALQSEGVLVLSAGPRVLRLLPPLTIEHEDLDRVVEAFKRVLSGETVLK
jgi:acetylornithine/LysW-gamma-L-lysine aminotransferase